MPSKFNFVEKFVSWINMIFKEAKTSILTNGFCSTYFKISRSMRQGCPEPGAITFALSSRSAN